MKCKIAFLFWKIKQEKQKIVKNMQLTVRRNPEPAGASDRSRKMLPTASWLDFSLILKDMSG